MTAHYEVEIHRNAVGLLYGQVYRVRGAERKMIGVTIQHWGGLATSRTAVIQIATQIARAYRDRHETPDVVKLEL